MADVAVVGVDDERAGQLPRAFIVRFISDIGQVKNYLEYDAAGVTDAVREHEWVSGCEKRSEGECQL